MAFTHEEERLIEAIGNEAHTNGYPFMYTDQELDKAVAAIKRERGDVLEQERREIRVEFATRYKLKFALDGGFIDATGNKHWPYGGTLFGKLWREYEDLVLKHSTDFDG